MELNSGHNFQFLKYRNWILILKELFSYLQKSKFTFSSSGAGPLQGPGSLSSGPVQSRVLDPIHAYPIHASPRSSSGSGPQYHPCQGSGFFPVQGPLQSSIQDPIQSRVQDLVQSRFRMSAAPPPSPKLSHVFFI